MQHHLVESKLGISGDKMRRFFPKRPTLRQLPLTLASVALFGAAIGPAVSLFMGWVAGAPLGRIFLHPFIWLAGSCAIGAIFAVSFYSTCALPIRYIRPHLSGYPPSLARAVIVATAMAGGGLGCIFSIGGVRLLFGPDVRTPVSMGKLAIIDGMIAVVISLVMSAFARQRAEKELRERTLSEAAAKAQAYALQAQINPHFFFNTLNSISALIPLDPDTAQQNIARLADMFRYALSCSQTELVPLESELAFVKNYLMLEQARFQQRVQFEMPPDGAAQGIMLPGLTLQPLVENAIRHGIARRLEGGAVRVSIHRTAAGCCLTVTNPFDASEGIPDLSPGAIFRPGHALANIRDRLALAFGSRASLDLAVNGGGSVQASVNLPALTPGA